MNKEKFESMSNSTSGWTPTPDQLLTAYRGGFYELIRRFSSLRNCMNNMLLDGKLNAKETEELKLADEILRPLGW